MRNDSADDRAGDDRQPGVHVDFRVVGGISRIHRVRWIGLVHRVHRPLHDDDSRRRVVEFLRRSRPDLILTAPPADYLARLEQASIANTLDNLLTFPRLRKLIERGRVTVHGAYFAVATGELSVLDPRSGRFVPADIGAVQT